VGIETGDDAAVYKLSDDLALVQTVDFFPPIVDDPYWYGAIAVANSLSDVYAMGAKPLIALNIVGFPIALDKSILKEILKGGHEKAVEAGVLIAGGHTVDDQEPKYGLSVTGIVKPGDHVTNVGAKAGDMLVLTKPIGTGIITTAGKQGSVGDDILDAAIRSMAKLNKGASESMLEVGINACTDITGFGLIGHMRRMVQGSGVKARIDMGRVPVLNGVWELLEDEIVPGGTVRNLQSVNDIVDWPDGATQATKLLLCDAQTSGGLLISVPKSRLDGLMVGLESREIMGSVIGEIIETDKPVIEVVL